MTLQNVEDIFPLTPMQHLMLMHSLRQQGTSSTLANQFCYRLSGALDVERFSAAWQAVIDRHEALRTMFVWDGVPQPVQVVRSQTEVPLDYVDLRQFQPAEQNTRLAALQKTDRNRSFDIRRAPLMRLTLIALSSDEHILLWSRHHLILDLWSAELLFNEVFAHYSGNLQTLAPAGYFSDYIAWLQEQDTAQAEAFWCDQLAGLSAPSLLFSERARRSEWSEQGQPVLRQALDRTTETAIKATLQGHGLTAGSFFQGVLALVIAAELKRLDVVIGLTVSGRTPEVEDIEQTMGSFINNVPVRVSIEPAQTIAAFLQNIQRVQAQRLPFEYISPIDVQRWSGFAADMPLYDVLLLLQSPAASPAVDADIKIETLEGPYDSAFPMTLAVEGHNGSTVITAVYDEAVVTEDKVAALVAAICDYAQRLSVDPDSTLASVLADDLTTLKDIDAAVSIQKSVQISERSEKPASNPVNADAAMLLQIWRDTLGIPSLSLDDDFFAVGATSIQAAVAFTEIERCFGKTLPLSTLFKAGSVRKLMAALELPPEPFSSLVRIQPQGARPAIIAIGGMGGDIVGMSDLARALGKDQPYFGLQSQGLDGVTEPARTIEGIATGFLDAMKPVGPRPLVLFGVCFGASVALEIAHRLKQQGQPAELLIVLDPALEEGDGSTIGPPPKSPGFIGFVTDRVSGYINDYRSLSREQRRQWWLQKRNNLLDKIRHRDALRGNRFELTKRRVEAANYAAALNYRPHPYDGATRVLLTADRELPHAEDPRLKWKNELVAAADIGYTPGKDTGTTMRDYAPVIATHIRQWIDEVYAPAQQQSRDQSARGIGQYIQVSSS